MMSSYEAMQGYKTVQREMNSEKGIELRVFSSVTSALMSADKEAIGGATELAEALVENAKLWNILFIDLVNLENTLPMDLKQNLISLAEFTQSHTLKVLAGDSDEQVLIDINQSMITGLRQSAALLKNSTANQTKSTLTEAA